MVLSRLPCKYPSPSPLLPTFWQKDLCLYKSIDKVNTMAIILELENRSDINGSTFVWSRNKALANQRKHGVSFDDAATVFDDPLFILIDASRHDEQREAVIGFDQTGCLLFVVHIEVDHAFIRIISARRAEPEEEVLYAQ